ncbi:MAG: hypothetical protein ACJ8AH_06285 [Stellaceae bacterium]
MILTPQELLAAVRRTKDYNDLMLELSGLAAGIIPRFLSPAQLEKIREAAGLPPRTGETRAEQAWRQYLEFTVTRQLAAVHRAIERALIKSERRVQAAQEALDDIRSRATIDGKGRRVYRTTDRQRGFTDDGQELSREEVDSINWDPQSADLGAASGGRRSPAQGAAGAR